MAGLLIKTLQSLRSTSLIGAACSPGQHILEPAAVVSLNYIQNRGAARRGKRIERARLARANANKRRLLEAQNPKTKKNLKKNIVKVDSSLFRFQSARELDMTLPEAPEDDVYFFDKFMRERFCLEDILQFHRQAVHPDVLNQPDALVSATIELNLKMNIKKRKYIESINSTVCFTNIFQYQVRPRKIVALCTDPATQDAAKEAGAIMAGGLDVVALLKSGLLTQRDFDHIVCHSDFLEDFAAVKKMKGSAFFPSKQRGNYGDNMVELVKYFKNGVDYSLQKVPDNPSVGFIDCYFGRLNMTDEQLRQNLDELFASINRFKPMNLADDMEFIERVLITNSATKEVFLLSLSEEDDQIPEVEQAVGAVAK